MTVADNYEAVPVYVSIQSLNICALIQTIFSAATIQHGELLNVVKRDLLGLNGPTFMPY